MTDSTPPLHAEACTTSTKDPWAAPGGLAWIVIAAVAWADQMTKFWVLRSIAPLPDPRGLEVFRNLLYFHYKENTGVAFSLFEGHPEILSIITTVAIGVIGWWAWSVPRRDRLMRFAFGLVLGGAIGNLIDRWVRGFVVDFIDVIIPGPPGRWHEAFAGSRHFATFNVADSAICIGMGLLILTLFLGEKRRADDTVTR